MILILTGINLLTYFKGKVSRELRFIIIGSDFKWESIMAGRTRHHFPGMTLAAGGFGGIGGGCLGVLI